MILIVLISITGIVSVAIGHSLGWEAGWDSRDTLRKK